MTLSSIPLLDITLAIFVLVFVSIGFWFGLIHMVGSVVGLVGGILLAGYYYQQLASFLIQYIHLSPNLIRIISFFLILTIVTRIVGFLVNVIDKIFKITTIIPFVKTFNRLLGATVGLLEGLVVVGLMVFFASRFPMGAAFELALRSSYFAKILYFFGKILAPLLPKALQLIQPVII